MSDLLPTEFAPAERADDNTLRRQLDTAMQNINTIQLPEIMPMLMMILNAQRQIVYANKTLLALLDLQNPDDLRGARPGEAFHCAHAANAKYGCGTTAFCRVCGAVQAILAAQQGRPDTRECRITRADGEALDLRVWAVPMDINEEKFVVFSVLDIRDEKRRNVLERIFFHDIMNQAVALRGFSELLAEATPDETKAYQAMIRDLAERTIEGIQAQRDLASAENNELQVKPSSIQSLAMATEIANTYKTLSGAQGTEIVVAANAGDIAFTSDKTLLRRVLGNMVKNAIEASKPGDLITIDCRLDKEHVLFSVHNPGVMPQEVKLQMFKRSFSTKGSGRGLGTYSIKLLSERYLKGTVSFTSEAPAGTTFQTRYPLNL